MGFVPLLFSINADLGGEIAAITLETAVALIILAVCSTVIGNFLWSFGLVRLTGVQASLSLYLIPLVSVLGGVLLLHEAILYQTILSGLLIVGGVAIAQSAKAPAAVQAVQKRAAAAVGDGV